MADVMTQAVVRGLVLVGILFFPTLGICEAQDEFVVFLPCQQLVRDSRGPYTLVVIHTHEVSGDKGECERVMAVKRSQHEATGWSCQIGSVSATCSSAAALTGILKRKRTGTKERYTYLRYTDEEGRFSSIDFVSSPDPLENCKGFREAMMSFGIQGKCFSHQ